MRSFIHSVIILLAALTKSSHAAAVVNSTNLSSPTSATSTANLSHATPAVNTTIESLTFPQWGRFCTDTACNEGCGEWIDMSNPGCLSGPGSNSFYVRGGDSGGSKVLIVSDGEDCPCQTECINDKRFGIADECVQLPANKNSWRWVQDEWNGCPSNNCWVILVTLIWNGIRPSWGTGCVLLSAFPYTVNLDYLRPYVSFLSLSLEYLYHKNCFYFRLM